MKGGDFMIQPINDILSKFWIRLVDFLPDLFGGVLVFFIGLVIAGLVKKLLLTILNFLKVDYVVHKAKLLERNQIKLWFEIIGEIVRWTLIILFLIPTLEIWRLSRATLVLNQFLFYLPNVIISAIILFVGLVVANLVAELIKNGVTSIGSKTANAISFTAKTAVQFFTFLIVLNQLGVAQDLIRILFTGIVAMVSIAGGIAFGLGGKDLAKELLEELKKNIK